MYRNRQKSMLNFSQAEISLSHGVWTSGVINEHTIKPHTIYTKESNKICWHCVIPLFRWRFNLIFWTQKAFFFLHLSQNEQRCAHSKELKKP